jgi:RNA polymerase I-specific transcription initiation factor RRN3
LDDDSDAGESDDEDEEETAFHVEIDPITGLSHVTGPPPKTMSDPFDLLVSEDLPKPQNDDSDDDMDDLDLDEIESDQESLSDEEERVDYVKARRQLEKRRAAVRDMRIKLDGMLVHFFEHLRNVMGANVEQPATAMAGDASLTPASTPSSVSLPSTAHSCDIQPPADLSSSLSHFQTLLTIFSRQILPTAATQHLPFLLFLTASISPRHTDLFLGLLVSTALYPASTTAPTPMVHRVASAVYIGSAVCRARFVDDNQAKEVMGYLLAYISGKLSEAGSGLSLGEELPLFYAVCQAAMLIFCFRWKAFQLDDVETESESGLEMEGISEPAASTSKWMTHMDVLQKAVTSSLNPLMVSRSLAKLTTGL